MFRLPIPEPSVTFVARAFDCTGGDEPCAHPAPYVLRDWRHRVRYLCIKHLTEYRESQLKKGWSSDW